MIWLPKWKKFLVHFAWIFTAFLLNVNLTLIASRANTAAQIWFACISLGLVVLLAIESLITTKIPNGPFYTIPAVVSWKSHLLHEIFACLPSFIAFLSICFFFYFRSNKVCLGNGKSISNNMQYMLEYVQLEKVLTISLSPYGY